MSDIKLYFNGCSFTYGNGLDDPTNNSWPSLIAKHYNATYLNHAVKGGSNDRIIKGVITNIKKYDVFYIGWSEYARFVKYNPVDNFEILFTPALNLDPSLHYSDDLKINYKKYKDFGKIYYKYWYKDANGWNIIKDWSEDTTATWTPQKAGTVTVAVWANTIADDSVPRRPIAGMTCMIGG